jgi:hypothetical protein
LIGTSLTGVHQELFPCKLLVVGQLAAVGDEAVGPGAGGALLLPRQEVLGGLFGDGVLDPLDDLGLGDEVNLGVILQNLVDPVEESVQELGVVLQPGGVEEKSERSSVLVEVSVEVVSEEVVELVTGSDVGAGVHHGAPGEILVHGGVLPSVQLVDDDLPDGQGPGGAVLKVAMAPVGHSEVESVGPQGRVLQGSRDGGVVEETLFLHHGELVVPTDPEERRSQTENGVVSVVGEFLYDQPGAGPLPGPLVNAGFGPECLVVVVSDGVGGDLVAQSVHVTHRRVVGVLMRDVESSLDVATVGILPLLIEDLGIEVNVVVVDGVVEGDGDHLRNSVAGTTIGTETTGNLGTIVTAVTVGQDADSQVTLRGSVGIRVLVAGVLVRAIVTVRLAVTEQLLVDTDRVTAGQLVGVAQRLLRVQQRRRLLLLGDFVAVGDGPLPVTGLLLQVKSQAGGTSDLLETRSRALDDVSAVVFASLQSEEFA